MTRFAHARARELAPGDIRPPLAPTEVAPPIPVALDPRLRARGPHASACPCCTGRPSLGLPSTRIL